jgi:BA14K-like protein
MISLKVLSTVAIMALVLPMAAPSVSFAAPQGKGGPGGGMRGNGGGVRMGGSPGVRMGGGAPAFSAAPSAQRFSGVPNGGGGNWNGGGGGNWHRHGHGFIAGAVIGGAIANSYGYYGDPGYYAPGYYDNQVYDDSTVAVAPDQGGDDSVAYCMQTYRSYDPRSGTYLGLDGYRHPCP